jgi:thymidine phosphorylase
VVASQSGTVRAIDCYQLARIARLAGAPMDKGAGIDLMKKIGDVVEEGELLYRIYSCVPSDFEFAKSLVEEGSGFTVSSFSSAGR